jgi:hypothetical protein
MRSITLWVVPRSKASVTPETRWSGIRDESAGITLTICPGRPAAIRRGNSFTPGAPVDLGTSHPMITAMPREGSGCRPLEAATRRPVG